MNAPPRRIVAPAALTASAVSKSCSRLSTEQGPAMTVSDPSPIAASSTRMTVSSGWNSREVELERAADRGDRLDAGQAAEAGPSAPASRAPTSPTTAITIRSRRRARTASSPRPGCGSSPPMTRLRWRVGGHDDEHRASFLRRSVREQKSRGLRPLLRPARPVPPGLAPGTIMPGSRKYQVAGVMASRTVTERRRRSEGQPTGGSP